MQTGSEAIYPSTPGETPTYNRFFVVVAGTRVRACEHRHRVMVSFAPNTHETENERF